MTENGVLDYEETLSAEEIEENEDQEVDDELQGWDDWESEGEEGSSSDLLCLFCDSRYNESGALFEHCKLSHHFDFHPIRVALRLDFYASFKLINYVRSQVAENRCWSCGQTCSSNQDLQSHLHKTINLEGVKHQWEHDVYLKPFLQGDSLLYSFDEDEEIETDYITTVNEEELTRERRKFDEICIDNGMHGEKVTFDSCTLDKNEKKDVASASNNQSDMGICLGNNSIDGIMSDEYVRSAKGKTNEKQLRAYMPNLASKNVKIVNEDYFGAYSSFGIHREMLSDKIRMDAYRQAILENPSLLKSAVVMDVGSGTGILSLLAAQAGASRVIAVEASEKMAAVATQIAKDNGLLRTKSPKNDTNHYSGVVEVVQCMIEELDEVTQIQPHSIDVLLSEWMGYCLLYESMLNSVLFARDRWLKPGGAVLPDTATILVAGFGKGGTSLPYWENVHGFNMSCVGKELLENAAQIPIVDTVDAHDLVTSAVALHTFDLATMRPEEVDFTASVELEPNVCLMERGVTNVELSTEWCYGVVLWFETGFTHRFCKEKSAILSTSPYTQKTHWSQTIFTFHEPIALTSRESNVDRSATIGTDLCPAARIQLRISIARASEHRSIDISLETIGISIDGRKHSWPVQLFNLR